MLVKSFYSSFIFLKKDIFLILVLIVSDSGSLTVDGANTVVLEKKIQNQLMHLSLLLQLSLWTIKTISVISAS